MNDDTGDGILSTWPDLGFPFMILAMVIFAYGGAGAVQTYFPEIEFPSLLAQILDPDFANGLLLMFLIVVPVGMIVFGVTVNRRIYQEHQRQRPESNNPAPSPIPSKESNHE